MVPSAIHFKRTLLRQLINDNYQILGFKTIPFFHPVTKTLWKKNSFVWNCHTTSDLFWILSINSEIAVHLWRNDSKGVGDILWSFVLKVDAFVQKATQGRLRGLNINYSRIPHGIKIRENLLKIPLSIPAWC